MSEKMEVNYEKKEIVLSRPYPFGELKNIGTEKNPKEVTVITVNELNGKDEENIEKNSKNKLVGFLTMAVSTGLTYDEVLLLATKDSTLIMEELQGF